MASTRILMAQISEGIVISKSQAKGHDLVVRLLTRSGRKIPVLCYGGKGGGIHKKGSLLELGHALQFVESKTRGDLHTSKEWSLIWHHQKIRNDYHKFASMCFLLETWDEVSFPDEVMDDDGLFQILSNALYYLDQTQNRRDHFKIIVMSLVKLIYCLGVGPEKKACTMCGSQLFRPPQYLSSKEGGFVCHNCGDVLEGDQLHAHFTRAQSLLFKDFENFHTVEVVDIRKLTEFLCYQFQLNTEKIKSLNSII